MYTENMIPCLTTIYIHYNIHNMLPVFLHLGHKRTTESCHCFEMKLNINCQAENLYMLICGCDLLPSAVSEGLDLDGGSRLR